MPTEAVTKVTALQIPSQPTERHENLTALPTGAIVLQVDHITNTACPPSQSCKASDMSLSCWNMEVNVTILLLVLAGLLILVLFYRVLLLRHRLGVAQARNALEYCSFYHVAHYSLKHPDPPPPLPVVNPLVTHPLPDLTPPNGHLSQGPPVVPAPVIFNLTPPPPPPPPLLSPAPPVIYTTPPSPQSDMAVYSRIGALRLSRHSGVSQTQVVLFEHSSL
ncbi:uncharacterized protein LOC143482110 [Brachyhypopomus gauderio]|uniref:uncharacterized protein LOC143482110 n=1 Tax=Brachyhypopomus gauderio TaxID=698409 RepID=UPI004042CE81